MTIIVPTDTQLRIAKDENTIIFIRRSKQGGRMFDRRTILGGIGTALFPTTLLPAFAASSAGNVRQEIDTWVTDHREYFTAQAGPHRGSLILSPDDTHVRWAAKYLSSVPEHLTPITTAKYMIQTIPPQYVMEWPPDTPTHQKPANPLIVAFFAATKTEPFEGDETAWCAAFACWLLRHCGLPYPNDAGSKSFREFGAYSRTEDPRPGDLVVFKNRSKPSHGHVAFFDGFADTEKRHIWCIGGNQGNRLARKSFPVAVGDLQLYCYRTGPGLRP